MAALMLGAAVIASSSAHGANPTGSAAPKTIAQCAARTETIRVVATTGAQGSFDNKPQGLSIGDYYAFHSKLETLSGRAVGRVDGWTIITGKRKFAGGLHMVTLTLPRGQITTQNTELPSIDNGNGPEAITGGTGHFKNVGGQLEFVEQRNRVVIVLHIIR